MNCPFKQQKTIHQSKNKSINHRTTKVSVIISIRVQMTASKSTSAPQLSTTYQPTLASKPTQVPQGTPAYQPAQVNQPTPASKPATVPQPTPASQPAPTPEPAKVLNTAPVPPPHPSILAYSSLPARPLKSFYTASDNVDNLNPFYVTRDNTSQPIIREHSQLRSKL